MSDRARELLERWLDVTGAGYAIGQDAERLRHHTRAYLRETPPEPQMSDNDPSMVEKRRRLKEMGPPPLPPEPPQGAREVATWKRVAEAYESPAGMADLRKAIDAYATALAAERVREALERAEQQITRSKVGSIATPRIEGYDDGLDFAVQVIRALAQRERGEEGR